MDNQELIKTVAPCGLVCGVCKNATPEKGGCVGCKNGGGAASECYHAQYCAQKQLDGCWECDAFPCDKGFFEDSDDPAFRGICIGSVMALEELGLENYADRVVARMGEMVEYGDWRYKDPEDADASCATGRAPNFSKPWQVLLMPKRPSPTWPG